MQTAQHRAPSRLTDHTGGILSDASAWWAEKCKLQVAGQHSLQLEHLQRLPAFRVYHTCKHWMPTCQQLLTSCSQTCLGHVRSSVACCMHLSLQACSCVHTLIPLPPHVPLVPSSARVPASCALTGNVEHSWRSTPWAASRSACCCTDTCRWARHSNQKDNGMPQTTRTKLASSICPPSSAPPKMLQAWMGTALHRIFGLFCTPVAACMLVNSAVHIMPWACAPQIPPGRVIVTADTEVGHLLRS
jgi:hypothetical protein